MPSQPTILKNSIIRPLVKLTRENRDAYEQLLWDNAYIWAIPEHSSFEEILSHMIREQMTDGREERRQELIMILEMMDLSDIPE
jgi:hypothetical protein